MANENEAEFTKLLLKYCFDIGETINDIGIDDERIKEVDSIIDSISPLRGEEAFVKGWKIFLIYLEENFGSLQSALQNVNRFLSCGTKQIAHGIELMDFKDSTDIAWNVCKTCGTDRRNEKQYKTLYYSLLYNK